MLGGLRSGRRLLPNADINVTALVDVAFVLLIVFMITAPIMQGGVDVQLPRGEARPIQPKEGLVVSIDQAGRIFVDEAPLTFDDFRAAFPALATSRGARGVYLRADRRVDYGKVVRVLATMRAAGVNDIGLVAEEEEIQQ
ncbi:MAG: biopolymer transporter ExbD [Gemmatimonadetes bacterium]|nr:biopolymer transporter ExbD [Gemmatimonadota bacterium]